MAYNRGFSLDAARLDLIDAVYAAATDQTRWHELNDRARNWLGGGSATFFMPREEDRLTQFVSGNLDPDLMQAHDEYYHAISPWVFRLGNPAPLDLVEEMVPLDELVRSEYYNEWMKPQDFHYMMGIRPTLANGDVIGFAIGRSKDKRTFDKAEQQLLIDIVPHVARAADIARRFDLLGKQSQVSSALLDVLGAGVVLVDRDARIVFSNVLAETVLTAGRGISIRDGRLRGGVGAIDAELRSAIAEAVRSNGGKRGAGATVKVPRSDEDLPLTISVFPFDERVPVGLGAELLACLVISVPEVDVGLDPDRLRAAYDLTAAEARLVIALCSGRSLAEYGEEAGISINTAKYHLKAVFDKTGETRQAELVRRMLSNPAIRAGQPG